MGLRRLREAAVVYDGPQAAARAWGEDVGVCGVCGLNYYEHHLGDWAAATGHLSWDEDMAYTRLLRAYYHHERAIPDGQQYRLAKASTPAQRKAVDQVLAEFFELRDGHHHQKRADAEIAKYLESEPERDAKKANERERQRRTRERRKELFNALREVGVVPSYDAPMSELQTLASRNVTRDVTPPVTRDATATHTQTHTQEKRKNPPATRVPLCPDGVSAQTWADWLQLRKAKKAPVTQTVVDGAVAEAAKAGMTTDQFLAAWCSRGSQGMQADWLKPHERPAQAATGRDVEPEWRREQRERNLAYLGPAAARRRPTTIDAEATNAAPDLLG